MARTEYGTTWWGKQWLEALGDIDYDNRIPRGKTYANTGRVLSFKIDSSRRVIKARVEGNYDPYYRVTIGLPPITQEQISELVKRIAASPLILAKLATRKLDPQILSICRELGIRLFPKSWSDMELSCSCPDFAVPCKHMAAVIYIMSREIDANPFILFSLRGIDLIKELEKEGVSIKRAKKAEIPTWQHLLKKKYPPVENLELDTFTVLSAEGRKDWLEKFKPLVFQKITFDADSLFKILTEQPAGYVQGDLRALTAKVLKNAAKLAKKQINDVSERTPPLFEGEHEMICINSWGQARVSPDLFWKEFDLDKKGLVNRKVGEKRSDGSVVRYHEMFSGYINSKRLEDSPESVEALYYCWVLASKITLAGAIVPQMYEPVPKCFAVRWIPATSDQTIKTLVVRLGNLLKGIDREVFDILKCPDEIDDQTLGEVFLGSFIQSYVTAAFQSASGTESNVYEQAALLKGGFIDTEDEVSAEAARLRLSEWLSSLTVARLELQPVLTISEDIRKRSDSPEREELLPANVSDKSLTEEEIVDAEILDDEFLEQEEEFEPHLTIKLGFNLENTKGRNKERSYFSFNEFLTNPKLAEYKFDAMKVSAKLSEHCPEIYGILENPSTDSSLTPNELTPLILESIPALTLLGVSIILPKSLQNLLKPQVHLEVDMDEEWKGGGFLSLLGLLDFDWTVAVGNRRITPEEESSLLSQAGKVVRFHDHYVYLDPQELENIRKRLGGKLQEPNKLALFRAVLAGQAEKAPVLLGDKVKEAIKNLFKDVDAPLPKSVKAKLRNYQERGYRWMLRNIQIGVGSILADDMGLGKTLQVLSVLERMRTRKEFDSKPALIIVPTTLLTNWMREAAKFTPELQLVPFYGPNRNLSVEGADAYLTTYGTIRREEAFKKKDFKLVILDEAQAVKNHKTSTWKRVKALKAEHRIAMSGTPVENRLLEYWSIMETANPGLLGTEKKFKKEYADPIEVTKDKVVADQFKKLTEPFILRRLKSDKSIIRDLPEKIVKEEYCVLTPEQAALYQATVDKNLAKLDAGLGQLERAAIVIQMILQLKQICNAPIQFEKNSPFKGPESSGKMLQLFGILDELFEADRKVLIFTQFRQMGTLLQKWLEEKYGKKPHFIHGGLPVKERQELVDSFQNDRSEKIMILSLKAAGTGLNLTAASAVIHYDLWWNPAVENQATDRAFRIGQKQNVTVYRFITANSFEEKINDMLESKRALAEMTVATGEHWITELDNKQLQEIFTLSKQLSEPD